MPDVLDSLEEARIQFGIADGTKIEQVRVVEQEDDRPTQLYMIVLDIGWCEKIIANNCYETDALGIAYAVVSCCGGEVVGP